VHDNFKNSDHRNEHSSPGTENRDLGVTEHGTRPCRRSGTGHEVGRGHSQSPCTPNPRLITTTEERKLIYTNNKPAVFFSSCKLAPATISVGTDLVRLSDCFMEGFIILNTINFADTTNRENNGVSWNVRRLSATII